MPSIQWIKTAREEIVKILLDGVAPAEFRDSLKTKVTWDDGVMKNPDKALQIS